MAKRSPRLIFTEEERALPELERAIRKADRAAVKLEKAEAKIPKKTVKVRERVVDSESGKVRRAFSLRRRTKSVRPPSWRTPQGKRPLDTVRTRSPPQAPGGGRRQLRHGGGEHPDRDGGAHLAHCGIGAPLPCGKALPQSGQGGSRRRQSQSQGAEQTVRAGIRQGFQPLFPLAAEAGH